MIFYVTMFLAGLKGQPVDIQKFYAGLGLDGYNLVASIGAFLLFIGVVVGAGNAVGSYTAAARRATIRGAARRSSGSRSRRPRIHNFDAVPDVRSPEPMHDIREAIRERDELWPRQREPEPAVEPEATPEPAAEPEPEAVVAGDAPDTGSAETPDAEGGGGGVSSA